MQFLTNGQNNADARILLAHGAGAPMDSPFMDAISEALANRQISVSRFEFPYMAARREGGSKAPPPRAEKLMEDFRTAVEALGAGAPLFIGGKSLGGRVASMVADDLFRSGGIAGLICLGYPFHPAGKPSALRTAHLETLKTPALVCQGTRDPLGAKDEVEDYKLSKSIRIYWLDDGDHDFKPRKASGHTQAGHLESAADAIAGWVRAVGVIKT